STRFVPLTRLTFRVQDDFPFADAQDPELTRTSTLDSSLPPKSQAVPDTVTAGTPTVAPFAGEVIVTTGGTVSCAMGCISGYRSLSVAFTARGVSPMLSPPVQSSCNGPRQTSIPV